MATTRMALGPHWEAFIKSEVDSGRYATASEVVIDGLRLLEERSNSLKVLRAHLSEGAAQTARGIHVEEWNVDDILNRAESHFFLYPWRSPILMRSPYIL